MLELNKGRPGAVRMIFEQLGRNGDDSAFTLTLQSVG